MAIFEATHIVSYDGNSASPSGDGANLLDSFAQVSTLSDGEDDNIFDAGDTIPGGSFVGTTMVNGKSWPVFRFASGDGQGGTIIDFLVYLNEVPVDPPAVLEVDETGTFVCFAAGTLIATPKGDVAVEALAIGDLVTTADGRAVPVKWLGRQTLAPMFQRARLVRVTAGALGDGLPLRDLVVTADHALMIDGLLVNAGALVNGSTITVVKDLPERVTVYHVETEAHDVILAEGTPTETFIDYAGRQAFDNYAEYVALYGADRAIAENPAPRISSARMLPAALKARLGISRAA